MKCPNCNSENIIKHGIRNDRQLYKCKNKACNYRFSDKTKIKKNSSYFVTKALQLWLEGLTYKAIAQLLGFDEETISRWLQPYEKNIESLRLDRKGVQKEVSQINDTIIVRAKSPYSSGYIFTGTNQTEMWGISRKNIFK
ncbi:MAG: helix-turn-helix domain-containing protein [Bacteroidales bacterium]|nr:helix-turn-helix domain-containing protein [Bacteroidales bacterium]